MLHCRGALVGMSKDYHAQTDQFQYDLNALIDKYTIGDADGPDKKVLDSPLEPRLNFQTIIGCMHIEMQDLVMINHVNEALDAELDEDADSP